MKQIQCLNSNCLNFSNSTPCTFLQFLIQFPIFSITIFYFRCFVPSYLSFIKTYEIFRFPIANYLILFNKTACIFTTVRSLMTYAVKCLPKPTEWNNNVKKYKKHLSPSRVRTQREEIRLLKTSRWSRSVFSVSAPTYYILDCYR